jgi:hypothetical protein
MARLYRTELKEIDDANNAKYGNFLNNHDAVLFADHTEKIRLHDKKLESQDCQSDFMVLRTKETDKVLNGWDNADEDGQTQDEGNAMGSMARGYEAPDAAGAECLPALINKCPKAQITDAVWGYDYDWLAHRDQDDEEQGTGHTIGLERSHINRHFVNDECTNIAGSSCDTACPLPKYDHYIAGPNVRYICGADGNWKADLKKYSKIKVFTHLSERELSEWAAFRGTQVDCTFCNDVWPKMLNLDVVLQNHDPIVTLQSYLNYRGIDCDVWTSSFVTEDATDPNKIFRHRTTGDADGASMFIESDSGKLTTASQFLRGTDFVQIPSDLCTSAVRQESGENGGRLLIPGNYNLKVKGGEKAIQLVFTGLCHGGTWSRTGNEGNYATKSAITGDWDPAVCQKLLKTDDYSHGGAGCSDDIWSVAHTNGHCSCVPKTGRWRPETEDCDSYVYGTTKTYKFTQKELDSSAMIHCNGTYDQGGVSGELTEAGSGMPLKFAKRNSDPSYGIKNGWFFRAFNDEGTEWEFVKQGLAGFLIEEKGAEASGWSMKNTLSTSMGKIHGPFGTDVICSNCQVHKTIAIPEGGTTCDVSFRFMRQKSWDHEWGYFHFDGEVMWEKRGVGSCSGYGWQQGLDLTNVDGAANQDCYEDVSIQSIPCLAGESVKIGFSSSINQAVNDESWAFTNFKMLIHGAAGDTAGITVHHYSTENEGQFAPNGKSDNFAWRKSGERASASDCSGDEEDTYAHKTYATFEHLHESCRTDQPIGTKQDVRVSHDKIIAWWKMETFDEKKWEWESIVQHYETGERWMVDFVDKGDLKVAKGGEGAHNEYLSLEGNTDQNAKISWGNVVASTMTLCTTSMYRPGGAMGRVFRGGRNNWIHGHHGGWARAVHYEQWNIYQHWSPAGRHNSRDWVVVCAATSAKTVYVNKYNWHNNWKSDDPSDVSQIDDHNYQDVKDWSWNQKELIIGRNGRSSTGCCNTQESGFRVSEVIAWNRGFDRAELTLMMRYLMERLRGEAE